MREFAVIFDFNGTMLFDTPIQFQAWSELAEETLGHGLSREQFMQCTNGRTSSETIDYFWGSDVPPERKRELVARKRENYKRLCLTHPESFHLAEGLPKVLDLLRAGGIPFTIATSSNPASMDFYFEHLNLCTWFDRADIICSDQNFPGKPAPDIYRLAARKLHMPPEQCVVVEDAVAGARAARAAGIGYVVLIDPTDSGRVQAGELVDSVMQNFNQLYEKLHRLLQAPRADNE